MFGGHEHAANRRALLASLGDHFAYHLAHEEVERWRAGFCIWTEQRGIQAVGLDVHAHALLANARVLTNSLARTRRPGKCDGIAQPQVIEQIAGRAAQYGERSRRKNAGFDHRMYHLLRQPCGRGRRFAKHRNSGQQAHRHFLPQAPRRKIEGIDVDGDSVERDPHMQALEILVARQTHRRAGAQHVSIAKLRAELGEILQRADRAVHINRGIGLGVSRILARYLVPLIAARGQQVGNFPQQLRALRISQLAQLRPPTLRE